MSFRELDHHRTRHLLPWIGVVALVGCLAFALFQNREQHGRQAQAPHAGVAAPPTESDRDEVPLTVQGDGQATRVAEAALGDTRPGENDSSAARLATLRIRLLDPEEQPVAGARCMLVSNEDSVDGGLRRRIPPALTFETDIEGSVETRLAPGAWCIEAADSQLVACAVIVDLEPGTEREIELRLQRTYVVLGRVTEAENGRPIAGARVWAARSGVSLSVITNVRGEYSFPFAIADGVGEAVFASAPGFGRGASYTDGSAVAGALSSTDIRLVPEQIITGRIVTLSDTETRIEVDGLYPAMPGVLNRDGAAASPDADGSFSIAVRSDVDHVLTVFAPGRARWARRVASGSGVVDVGVIDLVEGARVDGTVLAHDGFPLADVLVRVRRVGEDPGPSDVLGQLTGSPTCRTDRQGRFMLEELAPGAWAVDVVHGKKTIATDELWLQPGTTEHRLVLPSEVPVLRGRLTPPPEDPDSWSVVVEVGLFARRLPVDAAGVFLCHGLSPGEAFRASVQRWNPASGEWDEVAAEEGTCPPASEEVRIASVAQPR